MGYSMGSAQIYYGLAKNQDYFVPRVHRFIGLASCIYASFPPTTYENIIKEGLWNIEKGLFNFFGGDESSLDGG